jgi:hAT family C-terminal dimerisation region
MDDYTRYCLLDTTEKLKEGYLKWWNIYQAEFPRLARLARDIFGIPGISAEVERLFSSTKLMIPPNRSLLKPASIEAGECIRSWVKGGLFYRDYFEYLSHDERKKEHARVQQASPFG